MKNQLDFSALGQFGTDLTQRALDKKIDPVIGRDVQTRALMEVLCRRRKNNAVLLGEPGVGKTAVAEGLAQKIAEGNVPIRLMKKRIINLDLTMLVAGTRYRGEFESRLRRIIDEAIANPSIILLIDEMHTLIGAGSAEGAMDAANILKPPLARGELQCIGATTQDEYKRFIERDAALQRRFQPVIVPEPTVEESTEILSGLRKRYEEFHTVIYGYDALEAAASFSDQFVPDRFLPDKAIDLLDQAGARANLKFSFNEDNKVTTRALELEKELVEHIYALKEDALKLGIIYAISPLHQIERAWRTNLARIQYGGFYESFNRHKTKKENLQTLDDEKTLNENENPSNKENKQGQLKYQPDEVKKWISGENWEGGIETLKKQQIKQLNSKKSNEQKVKKVIQATDFFYKLLREGVKTEKKGNKSKPIELIFDFYETNEQILQELEDPFKHEIIFEDYPISKNLLNELQSDITLTTINPEDNTIKTKKEKIKATRELLSNIDQLPDIFSNLFKKFNDYTNNKENTDNINKNNLLKNKTDISFIPRYYYSDLILNYDLQEYPKNRGLFLMNEFNSCSHYDDNEYYYLSNFEKYGINKNLFPLILNTQFQNILKSDIDTNFDLIFNNKHFKSILTKSDFSFLNSNLSHFFGVYEKYTIVNLINIYFCFKNYQINLNKLNLNSTKKYIFAKNLITHKNIKKYYQKKYKQAHQTQLVETSLDLYLNLQDYTFKNILFNNAEYKGLFEDLLNNIWINENFYEQENIIFNFKKIENQIDQKINLIFKHINIYQDKTKQNDFDVINILSKYKNINFLNQIFLTYFKNRKYILPSKDREIFDNLTNFSDPYQEYIGNMLLSIFFNLNIDQNFEFDGNFQKFAKIFQIFDLVDFEENEDKSLIDEDLRAYLDYQKSNNNNNNNNNNNYINNISSEFFAIKNEKNNFENEKLFEDIEKEYKNKWNKSKWKEKYKNEASNNIDDENIDNDESLNNTNNFQKNKKIKNDFKPQGYDWNLLDSTENDNQKILKIVNSITDEKNNWDETMYKLRIKQSEKIENEDENQLTRSTWNDWFFNFAVEESNNNNIIVTDEYYETQPNIIKSNSKKVKLPNNNEPDYFNHTDLYIDKNINKALGNTKNSLQNLFANYFDELENVDNITTNVEQNKKDKDDDIENSTPSSYFTPSIINRESHIEPAQPLKLMDVLRTSELDEFNIPNRYEKNQLKILGKKLSKTLDDFANNNPEYPEYFAKTNKEGTFAAITEQKKLDRSTLEYIYKNRSSKIPEYIFERICLEIENPSLVQKIQRAKSDDPQEVVEQIKNNKVPGRPRVNRNAMAELVSVQTGIPINDIDEDESAKLKGLEKTLHERIIGQEEAVIAVSSAVRRSRLGVRNPNRPIASFIFCGPTGVGKTELTKTLATHMFGSEESIIRLDMSEYMERHNVAQLLGAPPGYVGYSEGGQLTEKVRRKPYSIVLFDEIEKAHPDILDILLQLLDDGRLTDSAGKEISFKNTIVILTSNLGANIIQNHILHNLQDNENPSIENKTDKKKNKTLKESSFDKAFEQYLQNKHNVTLDDTQENQETNKEEYENSIGFIDKEDLLETYMVNELNLKVSEEESDFQIIEKVDPDKIDENINLFETDPTLNPYQITAFEWIKLFRRKKGLTELDPIDLILEHYNKDKINEKNSNKKSKNEIKNNKKNDLLSSELVETNNKENANNIKDDRTYFELKNKVFDELRAYFRPEFLNRLDDVIVFRPLKKDEVRLIGDLMIKSLTKRLIEQGYTLTITQEAKNQLLEEGYDPIFGARPMRRAITKLIENGISEILLEKNAQRGDVISIDVNERNEFVFDIISNKDINLKK